MPKKKSVGGEVPVGDESQFPRDLPDIDDMSEVTVRISVPRSGPAKRNMMPTLRVVAGRDMLKFASVAAEEQVIIGRDDTAELRLGDATVSKRHARVLSDGNGQITVIDLNSTNGTQVNGQSISRAVLRPGDHLEIGAVSLRLDVLSPDELGHLSRVVKRLEAANRDPLTGLLTRAYIDDKLPQLAERCTQANVPLACAFVDVDTFKSINDKYGHQVGDEVLCGIARLLMLGVRDADPCVRYGGEEIIMFLPGSTEIGAVDVAERIRRTIAGHDWVRTAPGLQVTASFGVSQRDVDEPLKTWLFRADQAVLAAKRAGRNRVLRASSMADDGPLAAGGGGG